VGYFKAEHKRMAKRCSVRELSAGFDRSELELERASYNGDKKGLKTAMKEHRKFEGALLYRNTPKFKKKHKK